MAFLLLVSSDIGARDAWRVELENHGQHVVVAPTAPAAIARLREGGIDAVVVDHEVLGGIAPLVAGLELLPESPPLVFISGAPSAPALSATIGAAAFLPRSSAIEELAAVVGRVAAA
jgi:DNA-binding NtrC family response regulator